MTKPARRPAPRGANKHRDAEIRKIQIAKRWAIANLPGFDDDTYRDLLREHGGKSSSTQLDWRGRVAVLKHFESLGWQPLPAKGARTYPPSQKGGASPASGGISRRLADDDQSRMIRALWIDLHTLGAVRDSSEKALNSYVQRMTRVSDLSWLKEPQRYVVLEGLKDWRARTSVKLMADWCMKVYLRQIPEELLQPLQVAMRGLRIGEHPHDSAMKHLGVSGYNLLIDYKRWEELTYGSR